ncbi:Protein kinase-like domain protein [Cordyceps fumosorosea ARSEF 2679]|uniref:Protein kinase-like domain protein n=1 Tax=Cordyceps fumosorosea (strain ARSEF 2679) TaxID=1081104 RepID=A0A162JSH5_CORFA|nr:Protein kinase-like domain protein [Cordyceps fumosorosea ARSEF 2679]OAA73102.1 Protein kinase-like domain protein [Cordyceps fumosorosea ARSEF 2679]
MLNQRDRFYAPHAVVYPGGPSLWHVIDWDQRRLVVVKMDQEQDEPDIAFDALLKHIDNLPPDVYRIHLSPSADILSTSNDPKDDETLCVFRPPVSAAQLPDGTATTSRAELDEVARLGPNVDLVVYSNSTQLDDKFVFKYFFLFEHLGFNWHEMSLWCRLKHPNIVPFDRVVVDELEGRIVGFTSKYIPGGTLEENPDRVFKLKWLHQLIHVVDDLNLRLGLAHQDVAPRNVVIDEPTDTLLLFDFDFSARIGKTGYSEPRNDIKGVVFTMYEVITRDKARREKRHEDQDVSAVDQMDWSKHPDARLDSPVHDFRKVLDDWRERRRKGKQISVNTDAPNALDWPPLPDPEPTTDQGAEVETVSELREPDGWDPESQKQYDWKRTELLQEGKVVLNWQRPPQKWPEIDDTSK